MHHQKHGLSPRELEIMTGLAQGKTRAQMAAELKISVRTLNVHLTRAFVFLGAVNRVEAVVKLLEKQLNADGADFEDLRGFNEY